MLFFYFFKLFQQFFVYLQKSSIIALQERDISRENSEFHFLLQKRPIQELSSSPESPPVWQESISSILSAFSEL